MKLWQFIFSDERCRIVSARVAAPTRTAACMIVSPHVPHLTLRDHGSQARENGAILSFLGEDDSVQTAHVVSTEARQ